MSCFDTDTDGERNLAPWLNATVKDGPPLTTKRQLNINDTKEDFMIEISTPYGGSTYCKMTQAEIDEEDAS